MKDHLRTLPIISWLFGMAVIAVGILNMILIHLVPGFVYLLLSFIYLPPVNAMLKEK